MQGGSRFGKTNKNLFKFQKFKSLIILSKAIGFLTFETSTAFSLLRQTFTKVSIFGYFDLKYYIKIEANTLGYAMSRTLSQLILDSDQQYLVIYFLKKMISVKIRYKTYKSEILAIVKAFSPGAII